MKETHSLPYQLVIKGIPETVKPDIAAVCRSRLMKAITELCNEGQITDISVWVGNKQEPTATRKPDFHNDDIPVEMRAQQYVSIEPYWNINQLIVSDELREELNNSIELVRLETKVFDEWGLREFEPFPRSALNFHGPPGTGKTLAAHALSSHLSKKILIASYAQIESKYHGDGPKNVEALFYAAQRDNAVLFIDEADSLLSKRLTSVTQGSEQAINSMRSQLLICLEKYKGIVIFATNLVENYDNAFETRVKHVYFSMPNNELRNKLWHKHLPIKLPLASDIDVYELAIASEGLAGRDIKNIVIDTALTVARLGKKHIENNDILKAIAKNNAAKKLLNKRVDSSNLSEQDNELIKSELKEAFKSTEQSI